MANGFAEFERRMAAIGEEVERNVTDDVRRAALVVDQVAVVSTPVDTGRLRANWIVSVGHPTFSFREAPPASPEAGAQEALRQARDAISSWTLEDGAIFISNNTDYAVPIDEGHSAQAPEGMTKQAIAAGSAYLRARARLLRGPRG